MQFFELIKIIEHTFDDMINHVCRCSCGGHKSCAHTKGFDIVGVSGIHSARNGCPAIKRIILDQLGNTRSGCFNKNRITRRNGFFGQSGRMPDQPEIGIDFIITKCLSGFCRTEFSSQFQITAALAQCSLNHFPGCTGSGTGISDVHAFSFEIVNMTNP